MSDESDNRCGLGCNYDEAKVVESIMTTKRQENNSEI